METRELTCIRCPRGCQVEVTLDGDEVVGVRGNACPRGDEYARKEVCDPTRVVTTTVPVEGSAVAAVVSVKVLDVVRALADVRLTSPVRIGDVVLADVCGTGVDVVATKDV
mgnify:CR=1 FL=1